MSLKRTIQSLIPSPLLQKYKEQVFYWQLKNFDIEQEPDLKALLHIFSKNGIALDIGANIGLYTRFLSAHCSKVISVEPVPFTFRMLSKMVKRFDLKNVETYQLAVSSHEGLADMEIPVITGTQNYYRARVEGAAKSDGSFFKVHTTTLDKLASGFLSNVGIVKVDVEGHELEVLEGAQNLLSEKKAVWLIEIDPVNKTRVFEIMESRGYSAMFLRNGKLHPESGKSESVNWFFVPEGVFFDLPQVK